ncbi:hypothetical protein OL052_001052 [Salmonella enterica]|nr:hypothetical protein [Salmonella enterica]
MSVKVVFNITHTENGIDVKSEIADTGQGACVCEIAFAEVSVSTASVDFCSEEMQQATVAAQLLTGRFATVTGFDGVNFINGEGHYVN